jgi:amino acid adenylation domain-containing protein
LERSTSYDQTFFPLTAYFELDVFSSKAFLHLDLSTDTISDEQLDLIAGYYMNALRLVAEDPSASYKDQVLCTEAEKTQILLEWNNTRVVYDQVPGVAQLVQHQAEKGPGRLALSGHGRQLTFGQLNERANQIAHYLRHCGVGPEAVVAILLKPSVDTIAAMVGVWGAGGAYLPLDSNSPKDRLNLMLQDLDVKVVITTDDLGRQISWAGAKLVRLDADWQTIACESTENIPQTVGARNLAYVIYTSGSTGKPKAVGLEHGGLMNLVNWHITTYQISDKDRATQLARLSFDASVWEVWPYLAAGASIHVPLQEIIDSPEALATWLQQEEITVSFLPTPLAEAVLDQGWQGHGSRLRAFLTGGDRLRGRAPRQSTLKVYNHYGPTENTVVTTWTEVDWNEPGAPPIGRPISNATVYVLDHDGCPTPLGVTGELYIGGDSLARGYLTKAALTAEHYVPDPFGAKAGQRLYRTGDLVKYRRDGRLDFVGRNDNLVKIRGFELGEIEGAILRLPAVAEAAALVINSTATGEPLLVLYVVPRDPAVLIDESDLRRHLKQMLPDYMIPTKFLRTDGLPLTSNGKIDRRILADRASGETQSMAPYIAPRSHMEERIVGIWSKVLQQERIGISDDFFQLGGHSIKAMQVISRLRAELKVNLPLTMLYEKPTIAGLAEGIRQLQLRSEQEMRRILDEVENFTDEEVQRRLEFFIVE